MRDRLELQDRDIELLKFLGRYKLMSLESTKYIYKTITYQEKRIVKLVKYKYIKRLKHKYIVLGTKGKEYVLENGYEIKNHCRNESNIERLKVISKIAGYLIADNLKFTPSWEIKGKEQLTSYSRKYIGLLRIDEQIDFLTYSVYEGNHDKYLKALYYDIKREHFITNTIIFTHDVEKIVFHEIGFYFGHKYTFIVPNTEYGVFLLRNIRTIRKCIYLRISEIKHIERSDIPFADYKLNDNNYVVLMPLINMGKLGLAENFYREHRDGDIRIHIFGPKENESIIKRKMPNCVYVGLTREKIEDLLEKYKGI